MLIDAGAELDIQDKNGGTALMAASRNSRTGSTEKTVRMLIEAGAKIDIRLINGWTALMIACCYSQTDSTENTIQMLIDAGAKLDIQCINGRTALMMTCEYGSKEIVRMLIGVGAKLDIQNNDGQTALIIASQFASRPIIQLLYEAGSNLDIVDNNGITILQYAAKSNTSDLFVAALTVKNQNDYYKKITYKWYLVGMRIHNNSVRFKPDNFGFKIAQLHYENDWANVDPGLMNYLGAIDVLDLKNKVDEYLNLY